LKPPLSPAARDGCVSQDGLPTLRKKSTHYVLRTALARGAKHDGFRVVHYSAMGNHVHLVCEADDNEHLSRGMQGLCVRVARTLNRWWERRGTVFPRIDSTRRSCARRRRCGTRSRTC
jgi:REP element-mobilizing transposase RayT